MNLQNVTAQLGSRRMLGEPYETSDGTTVFPVFKVRGRDVSANSRPGDSHTSVEPMGVFTIKDGKAKWTPAVDATRIALFGQLIGLAAVVLYGIAGIRRPPWPDVHVSVEKR